MSTSQYKIILAGDGGVGKTTYLTRYITKQFEKKYIATLGVNLHTIDRDKVMLNIWDIAGQEKFGGLKEGYYRGAHAAIVMFDVTSSMSFCNVDNWIKSIRNVCGDIPILVCGNKCELPASRNINNREYLPISVKNNFNIEHLIEDMVNKLNM